MKEKKSYTTNINLVADNNSLYERRAFYKVKHCFYSSSINDGKFVNYKTVQSFLDAIGNDIITMDMGMTNKKISKKVRELISNLWP